LLCSSVGPVLLEGDEAADEDILLETREKVMESTV